jgi:diguanylate cyclase (GGDEF)-like protein
MAPNARAPYLHIPALHVALNTAPLRLQGALERAEELRHALASSQQELIAAQQQVALLTEANARLNGFALQHEREIAKVRHFAYHDELTGLANRALLLDRLNQALVRATRQQKLLALLLLDLDRFKDINDRLGHAAGDMLLQRVAERLLSCVRAGDTVCRYGGDEFVLLLHEVGDQKHALEVARKISARLAKPYLVDNYSIAATASIGVAVYPVDAMSQDDLIKQADAAMYRAKTVRSSAKGQASVLTT